MRTDGIKVKITIPIPFDKPDLNGVIHSKEAVEKITHQFHNDVPIIFRSDEDDNPKVIGHISDNCQIADWDTKNGICKLTVGGLIYYGGMDIVVNECHQGENGETVIDDFRVTGIGLSL